MCISSRGIRWLFHQKVYSFKVILVIKEKIKIWLSLKQVTSWDVIFMSMIRKIPIFYNKQNKKVIPSFLATSISHLSLSDTVINYGSISPLDFWSRFLLTSTPIHKMMYSNKSFYYYLNIAIIIMLINVSFMYLHQVIIKMIITFLVYISLYIYYKQWTHYLDIFCCFRR